MVDSRATNIPKRDRQIAPEMLLEKILKNRPTWNIYSEKHLYVYKILISCFNHLSICAISCVFHFPP